jgi:hypothetical protein
MKFLLKLAVVTALFVLLANEPPRKHIEAQAPLNKADAVQTAQQVTTQTNESKPQTQEPVVTQPVEQKPQITAISLTKQEIMTAAGIPESEWAAVDYIVSHESSWRYTAVNSIGATGLCQALPGSKMSSAGEDYLTNPVTQLKWCTNYAQTRYGGWWSAYNFWQKNRWW